MAEGVRSGGIRESEDVEVEKDRGSHYGQLPRGLSPQQAVSSRQIGGVFISEPESQSHSRSACLNLNAVKAVVDFLWNICRIPGRGDLRYQFLSRVNDSETRGIRGEDVGDNMAANNSDSLEVICDASLPESRRRQRDVDRRCSMSRGILTTSLFLPS
ncbi:hypothetical protein DPEC_G00308400 [Dallia pectoralis]|uniref:Uncharacterized protein n=1 Tax=Dallia pectoralis TaxID=75939 RepID=A0ACC2FEL9_DALPE|nr:hypothetical protein DPEC_G00308400 [Dallia pectoralis]